MCCVRYRVCEDQLSSVGVKGLTPAGFSFDTTPLPEGARQDGECDSSVNNIDYINISESGIY